MKKYFLTVIAIILVMLEPIAAAAANNKMPEIDDKAKNLTIHFYTQKIGVDIPISGAEIGIYKVAELSCDNGSANYELLPDYSDLRKTKDGRDVTFDGLSVSESEDLSKELAAMVTSPELSGITDTSGKFTFRNLSQGMYLVKELNAAGDASNYEIFTPYLISVPLAVKNDEGNYWEYDVISEPKTMVKSTDTDKTTDTDSNSDFDSDSDGSSDTDTKTHTNTNSTIVTNNTPSGKTEVVNNNTSINYDSSKVKTGYITKITTIFMILFGSAFIIVLSLNKKQKEEEDETT